MDLSAEVWVQIWSYVEGSFSYRGLSRFQDECIWVAARSQKILTMNTVFARELSEQGFQRVILICLKKLPIRLPPVYKVTVLGYALEETLPVWEKQEIAGVSRMKLQNFRIPSGKFSLRHVTLEKCQIKGSFFRTTETVFRNCQFLSRAIRGGKHKLTFLGPDHYLPREVFDCREVKVDTSLGHKNCLTFQRYEKISLFLIYYGKVKIYGAYIVTIKYVSSPILEIEGEARLYLDGEISFGGLVAATEIFARSMVPWGNLEEAKLRHLTCFHKHLPFSAKNYLFPNVQEIRLWGAPLDLVVHPAFPGARVVHLKDGEK